MPDTTTASVLIDLQNLVVGLPTIPYTGCEVVACAVEPADAFHHHGAPVVLVRLTASADGSDAAPGRTEIPRPSGPLPARDAVEHQAACSRRWHRNRSTWSVS